MQYTTLKYTRADLAIRTNGYIAKAYKIEGKENEYLVHISSTSKQSLIVESKNFTSTIELLPIEITKYLNTKGFGTVQNRDFVFPRSSIPADNLVFRDIRNGLTISVYNISYESQWGKFKATVKRGELMLFVTHTTSVASAKNLVSVFINKKAGEK